MKQTIWVLLAFFLFATPAFAQTPEAKLQIDAISPTPLQEVIYTLPYPGLLPDNPLYVLKAARDRVVSYLISDPMKKAEFDLLQADKRLQAGFFLLHQEKPNIPLALTTISKGQNYMHEAISGMERAKKAASSPNGMSPTGTAAKPVGDMPDKLFNAARKHNELLRKETTKFSGQEQKDFALLLKRSEDFITSARKLQEK